MGSGFESMSSAKIFFYIHAPVVTRKNFSNPSQSILNHSP
jgi:hypothetical protein